MTIVVKRIILLSLLLASSGLFSQDADDFLSEYFAIRQGDYVYLRWTIRAGNTCVGTRIQKAVDDQNFELIGEISGVCGSPDRPVSYEYYDTVPEIGKLNLYRLEMGPLGISDPVAVKFILYNSAGYSIQPNPVTDVSKIYIENPGNSFHILKIYNSAGRLIIEKTTNGDNFLIMRSEIKSGIYVFRIETTSEFISSGKIIIA